MTTNVHHRTCSLCDALCRLRITLDQGEITRIEGERDDPWSHGHICPKAVALKDLQDDPDRLRTPLRRTADGFVEASWDEAMDAIVGRLAAIRSAHGQDAVGIYAGNPNIHHVGNLFALSLLFVQLGTRARFSAQSLDNLPHLFAALHVFGHALRIGVPDVDRTDHLLVLGANPWVANGGGMSSGDVRRRIRGVQERGGRVIVIDPRRTETAEAADAHHALRPSSDALLLLAMLHVLFHRDLIDDGAWRNWSTGLDDLRALADRFPPERVAQATGLTADTIAQLATDFANAPAATCYARMGICTQPYGGLAAWLVVVLHAVTGNLDRPGGLMFAKPVVDTLGLTRLAGAGTRWVPGATRGAGLPSVLDELPVAALADEITRPGPQQVRALITVAGNPVLSAPNGPGLEAALGQLDLHVAVSLYLDETSRLADWVLPAAPPLARAHYPLGLAAITVRTVASWSEPLVTTDDGARDDWDTLMDLAVRLAAAERKPLWWALAAGARALGVRRILDALIKLGPHGRWRGGKLDLATIAASDTTIDLGARDPVFPEGLDTSDGTAHLAPDVFVDDVARLEADLASGAFAHPLVLIGRRTLRSNNSWMHNSERLVKGRPRCTLQVHPDDAASRGLADGAMAQLSSARGQLDVPIEVTDAVGRGTVCLPHGWGHDRPGAAMGTAAAHAGVSYNDLTDDAVVDVLTGTAAFTGLPVEVAPL